jgi:flagellar protein FliO/FliZ
MQTGNLLLVPLALGLVAGLGWAAVRWLPRLPGAAPFLAARGGALSAEAVLALDTRRRLHLVRCGGRRVLLLTGGEQDLVVGWIEAGPGEVA